MINFKKGFTLIEMLVILAILAILIIVVLPSFSTMRDNQILKTTVSEALSVLDKAKSQSLSSVNSSEYGIHFESDKIVIFKGTTYSSSDVNNEDFLISSGVSISSVNLTGGAVDIYFDRLSGVPNKTGSVTISVSSTSKIVTISATGTASMN